MILEMILEKKYLCRSFANMVLDLILRNLNSKVKEVEEENQFLQRAIFAFVLSFSRFSRLISWLILIFVYLLWTMFVVVT